jgi:hypothetical protein
LAAAARALAVARGEGEAGMAAVAGRIEDPTFGASAYKLAAQPWPYTWGHFRLPLVEIGKHAFYNFAREP